MASMFARISSLAPLPEMRVRDAEVPRPPPRLLLNSSSAATPPPRRSESPATRRQQDVDHGLGSSDGTGSSSRTGSAALCSAAFLFEVVRKMLIPLVAPEQVLEVCAALGAVDGIGQLRRQLGRIRAGGRLT